MPCSCLWLNLNWETLQRIRYWPSLFDVYQINPASPIHSRAKTASLNAWHANSASRIQKTDKTWFSIHVKYMIQYTDLSDGAVQGVGLRPSGCWEWVFESRWRHGCLSLVSVVHFDVEVSASGWSHIQRRPTKCCVSSAVWSRNPVRGSYDLESGRSDTGGEKRSNE